MLALAAVPDYLQRQRSAKKAVSFQRRLMWVWYWCNRLKV